MTDEFKPKTVIPFDSIRITVKGPVHVTKVEFLQRGHAIHAQPMDVNSFNNDGKESFITFTNTDGIFDPTKVSHYE
jgi:hypothetical protein